MADETSGVVEQIQLKLKTNFADELKKVARTYTSFVGDVSKINNSLSSSHDAFTKRLVGSFRNLISSAKKETESIVQVTGATVKRTFDQSIQLNEKYIASFKKLQDAKNKFASTANPQLAKLDLYKRREEKGAYGDKGLAAVNSLRATIENNLAQVQDKYEIAAAKIIEEINTVYTKGLAKLSADTNKILENDARILLGKVKRSIKQVSNELAKAGQDKGLVGVQDIQQKIGSGGQHLKDLNATIKEQEKFAIDSAANVERAKKALLMATNKAAIIANANYYKKAIESHNAVKASLNENLVVVKKYGNELERAKDKAVVMAKAVRQNLSNKALGSRSQVSALEKEGMDKLAEYAGTVGKNINANMAANLRSTREVEEALAEKLEGFKAFREEAEALKSTKLVDEGQINRIINNFKELEKKGTKALRELRNNGKLVHDTFDKQIAGNTFINQAKGISDVRKKIDDLVVGIKKYGAVSEENIVEVSGKIKELEGVFAQHEKKREAISKRMQMVQEKINSETIASSKVTNKKIQAEFDAHINTLTKKLERLKGFASIDPSINAGGIKQYNADIMSNADKIQSKIRDNLQKNKDYANSQFKVLEGQFEKLNQEYLKLSKKRFISASAINEHKTAFKNITNDIKKYKDKLKEIIAATKTLQNLQRQNIGGQGIKNQIIALQEQSRQMKDHINNMTSMTSKANRNIDNLSKKSLKSMTRTAWESVRNFRWQVAAVIYLVTRAVQAAQRIFFNILNEIQEYRKNAMSIAASMSFQMMGDMEKTFKKAYAFSRQLMLKIELTAAKTILTLEDMMMLTKTFAQAGVIPKTDEDVARIATIGTAIKTLTEGMANAGVQMKQELNAIIMGRQRATDSLAMMFKFLGVNIQKVIEDANKEGVGMIVALSDALEPFNELNRVLESEYITIINQLKVVWGYIKRIAGEPVLMKMAKDLKAVVDQYAIIGEKGIELTNKGKTLVMAVQSGLFVIIELSKTIIRNISNLYSMFSRVAIIIDRIGISAGLWKDKFNGVGSEIKGIVAPLKLIMNILAFAGGLIQFHIANAKTLFTILGGVFSTIINTGKAFFALKNRNVKEFFDAIADQTDVIIDGVIETKNAYTDIWKDTKAQIDGINESMNTTVDTLAELNKTKEELTLGETFKLPTNFALIAEEAGNVKNQLNQLKMSALEGMEKFNEEYNIAVQGHRDLKILIGKNLKMIADFEANRDDLTKNQIKALGVIKDGHNELYTALTEIEKYAYLRREKNIKEFNDKIREEYAQQKAAAENFLLEASGKPETREDKTKNWFEKMKISLLKEKETNKVIAKDIGKFWVALFDGKRIRQAKDLEDTKDEYADFILQLQSHKVKNVFEDIDIEMDKLKNSLKDKIDFNKIQKDLALFQIENTRKERKELELINVTTMHRNKLMDIQSEKAKYLMGAFSPIKNRQGELLNLQVDHQKALIQTLDELKQIDAKYKSNGKWIQNEGTQVIMDYRDSVIASQEAITKSLEREVWRKQHPLWTDLTEMSKNWADGLSDSLTTLVLDFENFADSIRNLWKSVIQDFVKAAIKRKMIEPLMNTLGSGGEDKRAKSSGLLGIGKDAAALMQKSGNQINGVMDTMLSSGQPIPVIVVTDLANAPLLDGVNGTVRAINETSKTTDNVLTSSFNSLKSTFSNILGGLSRGGIGGGITSGIGGLFGMLGKSASKSAGASAFAGSLAKATVGMADGGVIKEHIVGKGMQSGKTYEFGEGSEDEMVTPMSKFMRNKGKGSGGEFHFHMQNNISALDTRSGVEFLMSNYGPIEQRMIKSMKNNSALRSMVKRVN